MSEASGKVRREGRGQMLEEAEQRTRRAGPKWGQVFKPGPALGGCVQNRGVS